MSVSRRSATFRYEDVEVPEGYEECPSCHGNGNLTRYEQGYRSLAPTGREHELSSCFACLGDGYVTHEVAERLRATKR